MPDHFGETDDGQGRGVDDRVNPGIPKFRASASIEMRGWEDLTQALNDSGCIHIAGCFARGYQELHGVCLKCSNEARGTAQRSA